MPVAPVATVGVEEVETDYDKNELVEQSMEDNTQQKKPKPGDVRFVNINGQAHMMVIGREYTFTLKPGAVLSPYDPSGDRQTGKAVKAPAKAAKKSAAKKATGNKVAGKKVAAKAARPVKPNKKTFK